MKNVRAKTLLDPELNEMGGILARRRHLIWAPLAQDFDVAVPSQRLSRSFEHRRLGALDVYFDQIDLSRFVGKIIVKGNSVNLYRRRRVELFFKLLRGRKSDAAVARIAIANKELKIRRMTVDSKILVRNEFRHPIDDHILTQEFIRARLRFKRIRVRRAGTYR
jgi:hypothetical protein